MECPIRKGMPRSGVLPSLYPRRNIKEFHSVFVSGEEEQTWHPQARRRDYFFPVVGQFPVRQLYDH